MSSLWVVNPCHISLPNKFGAINFKRTIPVLKDPEISFQKPVVFLKSTFYKYLAWELDSQFSINKK